MNRIAILARLADLDWGTRSPQENYIGSRQRLSVLTCHSFIASILPCIGGVLLKENKENDIKRYVDSCEISLFFFFNFKLNTSEPRGQFSSPYWEMPLQNTFKTVFFSQKGPTCVYLGRTALSSVTIEYILFHFTAIGYLIVTWSKLNVRIVRRSEYSDSYI